uniref:DNA damage-regulated autophagy modulator protein 1 n=1 Tax=Heterorhabditis bacteriophora TaxID=37862 RepID=A0A1I7WT01_HETBA
MYDSKNITHAYLAYYLTFPVFSQCLLFILGMSSLRLDVFARVTRNYEFCIIVEKLRFLIIYFSRYSLVAVLTRESDRFLDNLNMIALFFGILGGAAMMIIANFQETAVVTIHLSAACICFGSGCIYMWLQSWITVRMYPLYTNRRIGWIRATISFVSTFAFLMAVGFGWYAAHTFHMYYPNLPTPRPWNRKFWQPGYDSHVISAVAEWVMVILHILFIISFSRDFEKLQVTLSIESLVAHLDHSPLLRSITIHK